MTVEPRVIVTGLGFPEGPVFLGNGEVVVTEIRGQCLTRCSEGSSTVIAMTGGGPNGATIDADGELWVANNGGLSVGPGGYWFADGGLIEGRIQRVTLDGGCEDMPPLAGEQPHRPNDLCFGPDGKLYFTDPRNWEDFANFKVGRLWRLDTQTRDAQVVADVPMFCNGIAFGADGRLYVAQSNIMRIIAFDWTPGGFGDPREFARLPRGFPDGLSFAANGDCYACGSMGDVIQVFDADGALKETIEFPEHTEPTNCCFGDGVLYVTCSGTGELLAFDLGVEGLPLHPYR
ncbi:MAG: SMP-30/gluconolactonase/LRE family protein [Actinomycetota bacterium]